MIVATASGSCTEEELLAHGFSACLFKPFGLSELLAEDGRRLGLGYLEMTGYAARLKL